MKASPPVTITRRGVIIAAAIAGVAMGLAVTAVVWIALQVNDVQQAEIHANQRDIAALKRTDERLRRIEQPTNEQLTNAALRALRAIRSCARSPRCRRRNPGVASVARSIPRGRIPSRVPRRRTSSGGGSGGTSSPSSPSAPVTPAPRGPSQTARRPQPTTRPAPTPANPPANRPQTPPAAQNPPSPSPGPAATVSTPATPPVNVPQAPSPPPLPVPVPPIPPLPGVCTPAVNVNCPKAP